MTVGIFKVSSGIIDQGQLRDGTGWSMGKGIVKRDELRNVITELCNELGFNGQIWDLRITPGYNWIRIPFPTFGFRVRIADPLIGFKIIFNDGHDVHVQDLMSNTDLTTNLHHPMSLNKIKSYIINCKPERLPPDDPSQDRESRRTYPSVLNTPFGSNTSKPI